jgi:hypothetical protein
MGAWLCSVAKSFWSALSGREEITATHHPDGGPARILLMRHAEKTGKTDDIYLSAEGVKRAERLIKYIPQTFGRPDFIYAAARSKRSIRSIETVKPLAAALDLEVQYHIEDKDFKTLVTEIFKARVSRQDDRHLLASREIAGDRCTSRWPERQPPGVLAAGRFQSDPRFPLRSEIG